jgi:hypothetical protein
MTAEKMTYPSNHRMKARFQILPLSGIIISKPELTGI